MAFFVSGVMRADETSWCRILAKGVDSAVGLWKAYGRYGCASGGSCRSARASPAVGAVATRALRYRLAYDAEMVTAVLEVFIKAVFGDLKRRARDYGIERHSAGAVTFVQCLEAR
jgi:hypothetical protein